MADFRVKEERTEKQFQAASKELKHLREKSDLLERKNLELEKETENWVQAKSALEVEIIIFFFFFLNDFHFHEFNLL